MKAPATLHLPIRLCLLSAALGVACACGLSQTAAAPKPDAVAWRAIGPGQFGAMFGIGISPHDSKVIVAGGDMGLAFMTRDGGQHWEMLGRSGAKEFANPGYPRTRGSLAYGCL
jgi:hypothetical protein